MIKNTKKWCGSFSYKNDDNIFVRAAMTVMNPWPDNNVGKIIFLLDSASKVEQQILEQYVQKTSEGVVDFQLVQLALRSKNSSLNNHKVIETIVTQGGEMFLVPLRVVWQKQSSLPNQKVVSIKDLFFGADGNPGKIRQWLNYKGMSNGAKTDSYQVIIAKGASLSDLQARQKNKKEVTDLPRFIVHSAFLALERSERSIKGARYKVPRMVDDEVLGKPRLIQALTDINKQTGRPMDELVREAGSCLKEMAATPTPKGLDLAAALGRFMYTRGFDKDIDFATGDLDRIRKLLSERPVAFLFTHKSHIDGFLLITLFHDLNLPPVHTFGGINMGFMGLGTIMRNAGAIFIRRSFKGDDVYKAVFKNYIDYLGEKRFPVLWALEGTRSRTGKLMPPRFGLINYVVSAYLRDKAPDLLLMPISIIYDQIPEVSDYDALQAGGKKVPESVSWFMQYLNGLKKPHGKIHVRFGQGVQISDHIDMNAGLTSVDRRDMQKIAFDLAVDVNNATPITVNSLITYVLLEQGHRAVTLKQLNFEVKKLLVFIDIFNFPMTIDAQDIAPAVLEHALNQLAATGVVDITGEGVEVLYMIPYGTGRKAAYYRNGLIHFFITSAIGELALLAVTDVGDKAIEQFHQEALRIRDLLKYEFFFEGSDEFIKLLEREFDARRRGWRASVSQGKEAIHELLLSMDIILAHGTLRPFLEAYLVFARAQSLASTDKVIDQKALITQSLALGKQRVLQQRIHCEESVSQSYFENAIKIAESRDLFACTDTAIAGRLKLLQELREITANVGFLASITETKRLAKIVATQNESL